MCSGVTSRSCHGSSRGVPSSERRTSTGTRACTRSTSSASAADPNAGSVRVFGLTSATDAAVARQVAPTASTSGSRVATQAPRGTTGGAAVGPERSTNTVAPTRALTPSKIGRSGANSRTASRASDSSQARSNPDDDRSDTTPPGTTAASRPDADSNRHAVSRKGRYAFTSPMPVSGCRPSLSHRPRHARLLGAQVRRRTAGPVPDGDLEALPRRVEDDGVEPAAPPGHRVRRCPVYSEHAGQGRRPVQVLPVPAPEPVLPNPVLPIPVLPIPVPRSLPVLGDPGSARAGRHRAEQRVADEDALLELGDEPGEGLLEPCILRVDGEHGPAQGGGDGVGVRAVQRGEGGPRVGAEREEPGERGAQQRARAACRVDHGACRAGSGQCVPGERGGERGGRGEGAAAAAFRSGQARAVPVGESPDGGVVAPADGVRELVGQCLPGRGESCAVTRRGSGRGRSGGARDRPARRSGATRPRPRSRRPPPPAARRRVAPFP